MPLSLLDRPLKAYADSFVLIMPTNNGDVLDGSWSWLNTRPRLPDEILPIEPPRLKFRQYYADPALVFSTAGGPSNATFRPTASLYGQQWHLSAIGNLERIWAEYRGKGVRVGVYDQGMDASHVGLAPNYNAALELQDASGRRIPGNNGGVHGTAVAGLIAGSLAGDAVGVAFEASLTSVPLLAARNAAPWAVETFEWMAKFDVVNNSWGPVRSFVFDNKWFDTNLTTAVQTGRRGRGTIIVNSAGNSYSNDGNYNSFNQSRYSISVGALDTDGDVAYFSTRGSSVLVSAPGTNLTTTDVTGAGGYSPSDYTSDFAGTSGAAPIVSGVVALMLSANPYLGWRDVQEILALTANHTTPSQLGGPATGNMRNAWTINRAGNVNGGGLHFSNDVGFGEVDAYEAVRLAEVWTRFTTSQTSQNEQALSYSTTLRATSSDVWSCSFTVTSAIRLEHADLTLGFYNPRHCFSNLLVELVSADGTVSKLSDSNNVWGGPLENAWTFGSEAFRGELSAGTWTLRITSAYGFDPAAQFAAKLDLYGSSVTKNNVYHYTDEFWKMLALDPSRATLRDTNGGTDWIDAAAITGNLNLNLNDGTTSTWDGVNFITIASRSYIENAVTGDGNDMLTGTWQGNTLLGMRGNDYLDGRDGNDRLEGGADNDTQLGGYGNDTLDGGTGHNDLFGGVGNDVFRFTQASAASGCTAIIEDFIRGQDVIDLSGLGFTFRDLMIMDTMDTGASQGRSLVVEFRTGGSMLLRNLTDIDESNFKFA